MELLGGSRVKAKEFPQKVLQKMETATAMDYGHMAFILDAVLRQATGYWARTAA